MTPLSRWQSLRWRLPLIVCGLVAAVLFTFLWAAYLRVEATLVHAAGERAMAAAQLVSEVLDGRRSADQLRQLAADQTLRDVLRLRSDSARAAVKARLAPLLAGSVRRIEVWDATGARVFEAENFTGPLFAGRAHPLPAGTFPLTPGMRELQRAGDVIFSDAVAEIREESAVVGFLLFRSSFVETPKGIFSRLIGRNAIVRVANRRGDVWANFAGAVPSVPVDLTRPGVARYRAASGEMRIGAVSHVRDAPWAAWVDFPLANVESPAHLFLKQMLPVAFVFLGVAAVVISIVSRRLTRPLRDLSAATDALARGDYSRRVGGDRGDEIGRLAAAFNTMAGQIQDAQQRMEARVAERTAQLEVANQELEAFSYSVSHDLRAPLRSIDGFSQALLEDAADKLDEASKNHLYRVRGAAHRMGELIDDLLELARVGRADLTRAPVNLSEVGRTVAAGLTKANADRRVDIDIQDDLVAVADRGLVQVVLENLLGNAWKFTAYATHPAVRLGCHPDDGDHHVFFVRDNGAGFDMTYIEKLFRPFQRLHGQREFPGTGIGLATVRRIIDRHGGRVWAEGSVGAGATIYFTLPRNGKDGQP